MRKALYFAILFILFSLVAGKTPAQEFRDDYNVLYTVSQSQKNINTAVDFRVKITNLHADLYVKKFSLTFPKTFVISNLFASDDYGPITAKVNESANNSQIEAEFSNPKTGIGSTNNFYLSFNQNNLFKVNGNVWEVILPTIEAHKTGDYQIEIHLPPDAGQKISIAKPKPDLIQNNTIYWKNPISKTIYAVFGDVQLYDLKSVYNLQNPQVYRVYTDIAFPPDMLHQKIFISSIDPAPILTYTDDDGNFIGRYYLNPKENMTVFFRGIAALSVAARPELQALNQEQIKKQKSYLLTQSTYWRVDQIDKYLSLKTPADIFNFVSTNFSYDYQRVNKSIKRLGANIALASPSKAVCLEFSDSFIALAREKGIFSREIEGYGFSGDSQLRPLSLLTDILHSWPEYFDDKRNLWISVDPTWQNTSGIDYFSSFDLDHIAFAIHGKKPDYPLPAGMYKLEDSRDVEVRAISSQPQENLELILDKVDIKKDIDDNQIYQGSLVVKNNGNVFQYNVPVQLKGRNLAISPANFIIDSIAPLEKKAIQFEYKSDASSSGGKGKVTVEIKGAQVYSQEIARHPFYYGLLIKIFLFILAFCTIFLLVKIRKGRKYDQKI